MSNPEFDRPVDTAGKLRLMVLDYMARAPRSNQAAIGSSEVGAPCDRKLAHRLAYGKTGAKNDPSAFRPLIGTWAHAGMDLITAGNPDWMTNVKVATPFPGTIDAYCVSTRTIVDYKFQGVTSLKNARKGVFSDTYRVQLDAYGVGMRALGFPVERVALWCLPSGGSLDDGVYAEFPHEPMRAWRAKLRIEQLAWERDQAVPRGELEEFVRAQDVADNYCGPSCGAFAAGMCSGFQVETKGIVTGSLGLTIA